MTYYRKIATELRNMATRDKAMRLAVHDGKATWDASVDHKHTARLKAIVADIGWPTIAKVGKKAAAAAWLIAQHADADSKFQAQCLKLMHEAAADEVDRSDLAYLEDRVRINTGRPQLYGTQFYTKDAVLQPRPIEDPAGLDKRRKAMDLKPFSEYEAEMQAFYGKR